MPKLGYIYMSVTDTDEAAAYYQKMIDARPLWRIEKFGAVVAALETEPGGTILVLNDHHPPPRTRLLFTVADALESREALKEKGALNLSEPTGGPTGQMALFDDPSGNPLGVVDHR